MAILSENLGEAIIFRVASFQHVGNEPNRIFVVFVLLQKLKQLLLVVIAGLNGIKRF